MEEKEIHDELASIRSLMERSSKFISLSGLSGILAGVYALIGAGIAYNTIDNYYSGSYIYLNGIKKTLSQITGTPSFTRFNIDYPSLMWKLLAIGVVVLLASVITAIFLTKRQAKRKGQPMWGAISRSLLFHMAIPLVTAGILILIIMYGNHHYKIPYHQVLIAPIMLIFYGFSLVSASSYTFSMIKYLGLCEIALGLISACLPGYGLLFWALGFGVLHIIYGSMMYLKYDR